MALTKSMKRFLSWRDFVLTPLAEASLVAGSLGGTILLYFEYPRGLFFAVLVFYVLLVSSTILFLFFIRTIFPPREGVISRSTHPGRFYIWRLHGFLCSTNLFLPYTVGLIPPICRKFFYRLLGSRMGRGIIPINGRLLDPYLVTIEESASIGDDVLLIPHHYAVGSSDILILDRIEVRKGAVVGPRCTLMPGVEIGENSMVKPMSLVAHNTKIPPDEIWGGIPAQKIADVDRPAQITE